MSDAPYNPQAFPALPNENWTDHDRHSQRGMTLRDYFAGHALAGISIPRIGDGPIVCWNWAIYAAIAYEAADAMLAARSASAGGAR